MTKKYLLTGVAFLALMLMPNLASAGPPGFYGGGVYATPNPWGYAPFPVGPTTSGFNYYSSPYGYRTYNSYSYTPTPWGVQGYQYSGTQVQPYSVGPRHFVYWDPFANQYRYSYR